MKLLAYLGQRLSTMIPTMIGLVIFTFFLAMVVPADPVALIAGDGFVAITSLNATNGSLWDQQLLGDGRRRAAQS